MSEDINLRRKAREAIRDGKLPNRHPVSMSGGASSGETCVICDGLVERNEFALTVKFTRDAADATSHHFHMRCFSALELELHDLELAEEAPSPDDPTAPSIGGGLLHQQGGIA